MLIPRPPRYLKGAIRPDDPTYAYEPPMKIDDVDGCKVLDRLMNEVEGNLEDNRIVEGVVYGPAEYFSLRDFICQRGIMDKGGNSEFRINGVKVMLNPYGDDWDAPVLLFSEGDAIAILSKIR